MLRMIDLFAGSGAFSLAMEATGSIQCVYANDMEPASKEMYTQNFPHHCFDRRNLHDVPVDDIPPHDILTAGFPCQPFSIAGKREGFHDERANVFWKICEIIDRHQPRYVLLENVKNICTHDGGRTIEIIKKELVSRGYMIDVNIFDTCKVTDIPQHRERMYLFAYRAHKQLISLKSLIPNRHQGSMQLISHFLDPEVDQKYYYTERSKIYDVLVNEVTQENVVYQYRRTYVRMNKKGVCPTLTANMGTGGHNVPLIRDGRGIRKLTPHECFRLQGFPHSTVIPTTLSDGRLYQLAGNAVSYPVVKTIADIIVLHNHEVSSAISVSKEPS